MTLYSPTSRVELVEKQTVFGPSIGIHAKVNDVSCLHPSLLLHGSMEFLVFANVIHSTEHYSTVLRSAAQCSAVQWQSCNLLSLKYNITVHSLLPFRMLSNLLFLTLHHACVTSITCFCATSGEAKELLELHAKETDKEEVTRDGGFSMSTNIWRGCWACLCSSVLRSAGGLLVSDLGESLHKHAHTHEDLAPSRCSTGGRGQHAW